MTSTGFRDKQIIIITINVIIIIVITIVISIVIIIIFIIIISILRQVGRAGGLKWDLFIFGSRLGELHFHNQPTKKDPQLPSSAFCFKYSK